MAKEKNTSDKPKNPIGRPTLYDPKYCEMLVEHMDKGYSFESFGAIVNHHKQTLYEWAEKFPEFGDAKRLATEKCRYFWEKMGIENMYLSGQHEKFNATIWVFNMKNRFKWTDNFDVKQEITAQVETGKPGEFMFMEPKDE